MSSSMEQTVERAAVIIHTNSLRQISSKLDKETLASIGEHLMNLELDDPDEDFIQKAKEELRETPEIVVQAFKDLRKLLAGESNLFVPDNDDFLMKFLRPCKWYTKSAFNLIRRHYQFSQNYQHIFTDLTPSHNKMAIYTNTILPLPIRNKDGSRILLLEAGKKWKPKEVSPDMYFRSLLLHLDLALMELKTQIAGVHIILDAEGLSLSHITYLTPSFAKMVLEFLQRCLPIRLKSINIVNQSIFFNVAFAIFKPFIEEKFRKRIFIHGTNRESLIAQIHKKALLKKYGGELDAIDESYGIKLWHHINNYNNVFKNLHDIGYITTDNKK